MFTKGENRLGGGKEDKPTTYKEYQRFKRNKNRSKKRKEKKK